MKDKALYSTAIVLACALPVICSLLFQVFAGDAVQASMHAALNIGHIAFFSLCVREVLGDRDDLITYQNFFRCMGLTLVAMIAQSAYLFAIALGYANEVDAVSVSNLLNTFVTR